MIKDRVVQVIEYKKIRKEVFYENIGMTSANFRGNAKNTPLNSTAIENILTIIPDLNVDWLITGKGEMLRDSSPSTPQPETADVDWMKEMLISQQKTIENLSRVLAELSVKQSDKE